MTIKVTKLTMFRNKFSKVGRVANANISAIEQKYPGKQIYQKRLKNGKIGLLLSEKNNSDFFIVDSKGVLISIKTENKNTLEGKLYNRVKGFYADLGLVLRKVEQSILRNKKTGKIEEKALRYWSIDGPIHNIVTSKFGRQSQFPVTKIAKNIHSGVAQKSETSGGDIVYWEFYSRP